jgi:hypothetical protein
MAPAESPRRTCVERGVYRQPNGNYAVCARHTGRLHFRTVGRDLVAARRAREELVAALTAGRVPASPRLRFDTVAGWWLERFEAKVTAGERHPRTLEAHRYHLEHNLLPRLASRRIAALGVEDVAALITELQGHGRSAKSTANALGTLQGILRFARRRGWVLADPVELLEPRSARATRAVANGCWAGPRSSACWAPARRGDGYSSQPPSTAACGSPSCSA